MDPYPWECSKRKLRVSWDIFLLRVSGSMWPPKFKQYLVVFLISLVRLSACHGGIRMSSLLVITRHGEATLCVNVRASKLSILFNRLSICNIMRKAFGCNRFSFKCFRVLRFIISWEQDCRIKMSVRVWDNCLRHQFLASVR